MTFSPTVSDYLDGIDTDWADVGLPLAKRRHGYLSQVFRKPTPRRRALPQGEGRFDAYPEGTDYKDEGCDLAPSCLNCPFARCRYDEGHGSQTIAARSQAANAIGLIAAGHTATRVAEALHVSRRTVMRYAASVGGVRSIRGRAHA